MNPVMIDPVEEQPDVDIQHEDYPLNVLDLADEPPILDMDIVDDHQVVEQENLPPPQNDQPALEENALPPEVIEPLDQQDIRREIFCVDQIALQSTVRDIKSSDDHSG